MSAALLTRAAILAADDIGREEVDVPEWGGKVLVRGMTAAERDDLERATLIASKADEQLPANIRTRYALPCLIDADGARLFANEDFDALAAKSPIALKRIADVVQRLSATSDAAVEDVRKN